MCDSKNNLLHKYVSYLIDLEKLHFQEKNPSANINHSCEDLIIFSEDLNKNIGQFPENMGFKSNLEREIQSLCDLRLHPNDKEREKAFASLKVYIKKNLGAVEK